MGTDKVCLLDQYDFWSTTYIAVEELLVHK